MLAERPHHIGIGSLDRTILAPSRMKLELVGFIAQELPRWRDRPDRPSESAETALTEQLCDHLNGVARQSEAWSHVQCRTETTDETHHDRKVDLTPKPCGATFIIEGRVHSEFQAIFPIECKRLPTPEGRDRDEREYVVTESRTTGGIQRFKFGYHGAAHSFGAMLAYVQQGTRSDWLGQVNGWIRRLAREQGLPWRESDMLELLSDDSNARMSTLKSCHCRDGDLDDLELRHLWVSMN